ncbi:g11112 [Coccomyxa viridis]|uniref:G11112 protein n=1 Tax=Coccomyxa viridis TaxID=1274662 RepID=A0ABP1G9S2_9CHLO
MAPAMEQNLQTHPARILVSSTRKPISYINLAKRFLQEHGEVQLSALGIAVAPMVTVAEILKNRRLAIERKITTSLEVLSDDYRVRQKPKMEIVLTKSAEFDAIVAEENEPNAADSADYGGDYIEDQQAGQQGSYID